VDGSFTVVNPVNKHGAIKHPDGTHRLLYSMESPESWVEDFGKGTIAGGTATVALDTDFAAIAETSDYRVFLTPLADCKGLYVTALSSSGFGVQEQQGGTSGVGFHWRVVARPKSEQKAARLGKFEMPTIRIPDVATLAQAVPSRPRVEPTKPSLPAVPSTQPGARPAPTAAAPSQGSGGTTPAPSAVQPIPPPRP
jgi:hypothetical protein